MPPTELPTDEDTSEIEIDEVAEAVKTMKRGNAVGPDGIPAEFWKSCGTVGHNFLRELFTKIKGGNPMPNSFRDSYLLPFYKNKGDSRNCNNYRGIKLLSHTMKIWERVINNRVLTLVLSQIHTNQCGFMPGRSTTDAIQALRILVEKHRDAKRDLHVVFIDLEKAFDRVPRDLIWTALRYHNVPENYVNIIKDMYFKNTTRIRCTAGTSDAFEVKVGVHQSSVLSPLLFNLAMNYLTKNLMNDLILSLLFADDVGLATDNVIQLQDTLNK